MKLEHSVGNGTYLAGCLGASIVASFVTKSQHEAGICHREARSTLHLCNIDNLVPAKSIGVGDIS